MFYEDENPFEFSAFCRDGKTKKQKRKRNQKMKKKMDSVPVGTAAQALGDHFNTKVKKTPKGGKKAAAKPAEKAPEETMASSTPVPPAPIIPETVKPVITLSLLDEITQAGDNLVGERIVEAIHLANDILANEKAVKAFVNAMIAIDALALNKLSFNRLKDDVRQEWYQLTLQEIDDQLNEWSEDGDANATKILATLNTFKKSQVDVIDPLWKLYTEIVRPANDVKSFADLKQLMHNLHDKDLLEKRMNWRSYPANTVVLGNDEFSVGYLPARENGKKILMIETGWPFVKEAEARVKENRQGKLAELEKLATIGFTSSDAKKGVEGFVFLKAGEDRGVLLQVRKYEEVKIRIYRAIGIKVDPPTNWVEWTIDKKEWISDDLYASFEAWKKS